MTERLNGRMFRDMIISAAAAVELHRQEINELNVFPVPDGDTGTNMSMTLNAAAQELSKKEPKTLCGGAEAAASAMLRGARGNSGVILSLLFRGFSKSLKEKKEASALEVAQALNEGVSAAYKAVMKPTEGTILTVSRLASAAALRAAEEEVTDLEAVLLAAVAEGDVALENTLELNPVLKKAGVVDAGGMGYLMILRAFIGVLRGEVLEYTVPGAESEGGESVFSKFDTEEDIVFPYCTEFIVRKETEKSVDLLRSYLSSIGDSAVVLDDEELIKVHVHSDRPGEVLTEALTYGSLLSVKVENMREQHTSKLQEASAAPKQEAPAAEIPSAWEPSRNLGVVAICAGDGLTEIFRQLGADEVVSGGQTMNPSTEDILRAVERSAGETVLVLPNNKNIIMAAQQCAGLSEKPVIVIPTTTVPQGISALLAADLEAEAEEVAEAMRQAMEAVQTISVTYAARDSLFDGIEIREGDYLALKDGKFLCAEKEARDMTDTIAIAIRELNAEIVSVYYGQDVSEEEAAEFCQSLQVRIPNAEVTPVAGGQPVYYYLISAE